MVRWVSAYKNSLISVAWSFLWLFIGGAVIYYAFFELGDNSSVILHVIILIIIGLIIIGLPFNTAFFKYFPELINKANISWGEAFSGSASYFGQSIGWGLLWATTFPGAVVGSIGIRASYYQTLAEIINGEKIEGKRAWRAAGHMFGWVLLWLLCGGLIIGIGTNFVFRSHLDPYMGLTLILLVIIAGLYLMIMGISAAEFKEFGDVIRYTDYPYELTYKYAIIYASWCILWLFIAGLLFSYRFLMNIYMINQPLTILSQDEYILYYYVFPIAFPIVGLFILSWGCLAAYMKYFGDLLEKM